MNFIWIISAAVYFVLAYVIARYSGSHRQIGYRNSLFWSIVLSPIIGFVITTSSPKMTNQIIR